MIQGHAPIRQVWVFGVREFPGQLLETPPSVLKQARLGTGHGHPLLVLTGRGRLHCGHARRRSEAEAVAGSVVAGPPGVLISGESEDAQHAVEFGLWSVERRCAVVEGLLRSELAAEERQERRGVRFEDELW